MKKIKEVCHVCGRRMREGKIDFKGVELSGWVCKCGEGVIPSREVVRYEVLIGRRNSDIRKVTAMGNSLVVSIPREYIKQMGIKKGTKIMFSRLLNSLKLMPLSQVTK